MSKVDVLPRVLQAAAPAAGRAPTVDVSQRSHGELRLSFKRRGFQSVLGELYQSGCVKARMLLPEAGHSTEVVLLNTAGGLTGGDRIAMSIGWSPGSHAAVTTQACEKIYRAASGEARVTTKLTVGEGATAEWLPQETILFDRSALRRDLQIRLEAGASFTGIEAVILGREAMGETVRHAELRDAWRIWRGPRLIYADALQLGGDLNATLARTASMAGWIALASIIHVGENLNAPLDKVRAYLAGHKCVCGASAWNGVLAVRMLAASGIELRHAAIGVLDILRQGLALPRVWQY